jgi:prolyl-tRNA synthetase
MVDRLSRERISFPVVGIAERLSRELESFQTKLFERAAKFQRDNTFEVSMLDEVIAHFRERGGFVWVRWCGDADEEARIKADTGGVTIRTIEEESDATRKCFVCGRPAGYRVALAKAY